MNCKVRHVIAVTILCVAAYAPPAAHAAEARRQEEARLVKTLQGDGTRAEKDKACRRLQVIGSRRCIPALAALLPDEKLSHIARYALEPMPYPEAGRALRDALAATSGTTKVGVITSLGFRRDEEAVPALTRLLRDRDAEIARAAAAALGRTGTPEAAVALNGFRTRAPEKLRPVAAEASLTAAEGLLSRGRQEEAARIYEDLRAPRWPAHARLGAFAGILKAKPDEAVARVVEAVQGTDPALRAVAIANIGAIAAPGAAERLARELPLLPAGVQAMLIAALADHALAERASERGGPGAGEAVRTAIVSAAHSPSSEVRTAAAKALGAIGDATSVAALCEIVAGGESDAEKQAAAKSLRLLRGDGVDAALVGCMKGAGPGAALVGKIVEALIAREATAAVPDLVELAAGGDEETRASAFKALGWLAGAEHLPTIVRLLVDLKGEAGRKEAELAAVRVSRKVAAGDGGSRRADVVTAAFRRATATAAKCSLLRVLSGIGDAPAFDAVRSAMRDRDPVLRDAAVRALVDWPDAGGDVPVVEALLDVYRTSKDERHRVLALRGCVRLLGLGGRPAEATLTAYTDLLRLARRADEKKLVLAGLGKVASPAARDLVEPMLADAGVRAEAEAALLGIARGIMGSAPDEAGNIARKLVAESRNARLRKSAADIIRQIEKFEDYVMAWQVAGPYGVGKGLGELLKTAYPPEKDDAKDVTWHMLPIATTGNTPWMLDLLAAVGGEGRAVYVRTWVHATWEGLNLDENEEQPARIEFGVDDGSKVWLNGKVVHANGSGGAAVPGEHKLKVQLRKGWNALVMKITQDTGPWQFCLRFRTVGGGKLGGLRADATREAASSEPIGKAGKSAGGARAKAQAKDAPPVRAVPRGDWQQIFNGRDLSGWKATGNAVFKVEAGCLLGTQTTGKGGDLWTEAQWDDFELRATYRVEWPANSGLWFRHDGRKGYQYDILKYKRPVAFSGTLYCPGKMFITSNLDESLENRDGWNEARIRAAGDEITLWLNGTQTGKCRDRTLAKGKIGIQVHAGNGFKGMEIIFKKIEVRALAVEGGLRE